MTKIGADLLDKPDQPPCTCDSQTELVDYKTYVSGQNERLRMAFPRFIKAYEQRIVSYRRQIALMLYVCLYIVVWPLMSTVRGLHLCIPIATMGASWTIAVWMNLRMWKLWGQQYHPMDRQILTIEMGPEEGEEPIEDLTILENRLTYLIGIERFFQRFLCCTHLFVVGCLVGLFLSVFTKMDFSIFFAVPGQQDDLLAAHSQ